MKIMVGSYSYLLEDASSIETIEDINTIAGSTNAALLDGLKCSPLALNVHYHVNTYGLKSAFEKYKIYHPYRRKSGFVWDPRQVRE